jgi:dihydrofolate synthase/folylpolyglutamate synthase
MDYKETIDYLYSRLPVFQNIGARAYKPGLSTTTALCDSLGNPQNRFTTIHVGGTNGKGSTSHMMAAVLQEAGYRVGLYTSPHLKSFTERIKVNGEEISEAYIIDFTSDNLSNIDRLNPSFFELTVSMAFSYFAYSNVDVAVIEVGMGGRLDSTNIITPVLSVITNVSWDHTQYLGDTLPKIAFEKAGIIKQSVPVVISERQEDISDVFEAVSASQGADLIYGSDIYRYTDAGIRNGKRLLTSVMNADNGYIYGDLNLDLIGSYQLKNVCGVLSAIDLLKTSGFVISMENVKSGLERVVTLTGLKGRWQKIGSSPDVYCDTAHNVAGLTQTIEQFDFIAHGRKRFVIGFVNDKDISGMLALFPVDADFYFTEPSNTRALAAGELALKAGKFRLQGKTYQDVNEALQAAVADSGPQDSIYVGGSTFVVADLKQI